MNRDLIRRINDVSDGVEEARQFADLVYMASLADAEGAPISIGATHVLSLLDAVQLKLDDAADLLRQRSGQEAGRATAN